MNPFNDLARVLRQDTERTVNKMLGKWHPDIATVVDVGPPVRLAFQESGQMQAIPEDVLYWSDACPPQQLALGDAVAILAVNNDFVVIARVWHGSNQNARAQTAVTPITPLDWQDMLSFGSDYSDLSAGSGQTCAAAVDGQGLVVLRGWATKTSAWAIGDVICRLPVDAAPTHGPGGFWVSAADDTNATFAMLVQPQPSGNLTVGNGVGGPPASIPTTITPGTNVIIFLAAVGPYTATQ